MNLSFGNSGTDPHSKNPYGGVYMDTYPTNFFISSGAGTSKFELVAFDNALISAGISNYNLVKVSSILPSFCQRKDIIDLKEGSPLLTAYASVSSNVEGTRLATAVAVGIPKEKAEIGIIMEYKGIGASEKDAANQAKHMVEEAMSNHKIDIEAIIISSTEGIVGKETLSLISALVMW